MLPAFPKPPKQDSPMNSLVSRHPSCRRAFVRWKPLGAVAAISILSGPIYAQTIPAPVVNRAWDAATGAAATYNWGDAPNWAADLLPGVDEIANFSPAPNGIITVDLGGATREVGSLYFSANGSQRYDLINGTVMTNFIAQSNDDPNLLLPTALVSSKNSGTDLLTVSVSSNALQLQGKVTSGGLAKFGSGTLQLGTDSTAFDNAISGAITLYGGTFIAAAGSTNGSNNPLGGAGDIVIGNTNVTLSLRANGALATNTDYDFVRNIRAGDRNFVLDVRLAGGSDTTDPNMRAGTLFIGNATMTINQANGFRAALDEVRIASGATATRFHASALTFFDGLSGDADSNVYKRGGSDLEIRTTNPSTFAGDFIISEGIARFISNDPARNPLGGDGSTVFFGNGYGLNAIAGGQTLQLRSNAALDFGSSIAFRPGVTIGTIDVNNAGSGTGQTLALGNVNLSGKTLRVTGGNQRLGLDNVTVDAGASAILETSGADVVLAGNLNIGAGATLNKIGGNALTLSNDNSATALGTINLKAGSITATVPGAMGSKPVTVGNTTPNSAGFLADFSRLNLNSSGTNTNATGADYIVVAGGVADFASMPDSTDVFDIRADGRIQGSSTQLAQLTVGTNLILAPNAIIVHETLGAASVNGLANDASVFYGLVSNAGVLPMIGPGTPWKGVSNDNLLGRIIQGASAGTNVDVMINGGDNNPDTIEATFQSMNNLNLDFGTTTGGDGSYRWVSTAPGLEKVTVAIRGTLGNNNNLGLVPGGRVVLREDATSTGLSTAVDKIVVQSGVFSVQTVNGLGGVAVEVQNNGALDIGGTSDDILDGPVTIKSGGVLVLNDPQLLGGTGSVTIEAGGKLDMVGAPADLLSNSTKTITFAGANHTVRFAQNNIANLDSAVPDAGVTFVISGGATAAILGESNLNVTTNTQGSLSFNGGVLTNDATSRGFSGTITLATNSNFTVAATRGTILGLTSSISTGGNLQVGSDTAIDYRDKNQNPDRVSGLGLADPYNGHSEVLFLGPVSIGGSATVAGGTRLGFADPSTNIAGDLIFNGTALYLDGGGELSGGSSTKGGLTARLTDTSGAATARVANKIILGNYARTELSLAVGTGNQTVTQPFVITGQVNPIDKRTIWVDRADASGTLNVLLSDILLKNNAQFGIDESNTIVRTNLRLDGNATLVRNHDDYDLRNLTKEPTAPANVTLFMGEPTFGWDDATDTLVNGSNATLTTSVDGTVAAGITMDIVRSTVIFEPSAVFNGVIRAQTAPNRGDSFIISRSNGATANTTFTGTGEIQLGRSVAANGPEDFDIRPTEVATGNPAQQHTVAVPVRIVDDGSLNIDGVVRSERNNDSNVTGLAVLNTLNVDAGATVQTISSNQTRLTIDTVNLGANSGIDSNNSNSVFLGNIAGGTNTIRLSGPAQARITGNVTAGQVNVTGAGIDFDPGASNTSTVNAPVSLNGMLSVRSGTADLGNNIIAGAAPQTVAGLRENKTQGSFDEATANFSNEIKLGPVLAQISANVGWGENQTATYTGQILIPDNGVVGDGIGSVAFAKFFDDSARVVIDGVTYLRNTAFNDGVATGAIELTPGWHDIEIRLGQGTGGAGPVTHDGAFGVGLGIDMDSSVSTQTAAGPGAVLDGTQYIVPLDNGAMNLFRTTTVKSSIRVGGSSTLNAGGFTNIGPVSLNGNEATLNLSAAALSDAETLTVANAASTTVNIANAAGVLTVGLNTSVPAGSSLAKTGAGTLTLNSAADINGEFTVSSGTVNYNATGSGIGTFGVLSGATLNISGTATHGGTASVDGGTLVVNGNLGGDVFMSAGVVRGSGTIGGTLNVLTGGNVQPGSGLGILTINGSLDADVSATLTIELGRQGGFPPAAGLDYDQVKVLGNFLNLGGANGDGAGMNLSIVPVGAVLAGDIFTIILNQGFDSDTGTFAGLANGSTFTQSGYEFQISYFDNPLTPAFETTPGSGSSVSLLTTIPEPTSALALLAGSALAVGLRRFRRSIA